MRAPQFLLTLALLGSSVPLHANWGSTAGGSVATGSFHAFGTDQIEMQREDLRIRLYRDRAKVEVDYTFRNTGPAIDVRAGFPSLGVQLEDVPHKEIEHYALYADGQPVASATESGDPAPFKGLFDAKFRQMGELDEFPPDKRPELLQWLVSTVHFDAGQSRHIHISYDSLYAFCGGGYACWQETKSASGSSADRRSPESCVQAVRRRVRPITSGCEGRICSLHNQSTANQRPPASPDRRNQRLVHMVW